MGRRPNPHRRVELLDEIVEYITDHGLVNLSLRPLAAALGTSTYTLTYQFGTKEELIRAALEHVESRQRDALAASASATPIMELPRLWELVATEVGKKHARLIVDMVALVASDPDTYAEQQAETVRDRVEWLGARLVDAGFDRGDPVLAATLVQALLAGLSMDLLVTNDVERTSQALDLLVQSVSAGQSPDVDLRDDAGVNPLQPAEAG